MSLNQAVFVPRTWQEDIFQPNAAQTVFPLTYSVHPKAEVEVELNGLNQEVALDWEIAGAVFTWKNPNGVVLAPTDRLVVRYQRL